MLIHIIVMIMLVCLWFTNAIAPHTCTEKEEKESCDKLCVLYFVLIVLSFILFFVIYEIKNDKDWDIRKTKTETISCLNDGNQINGEFYLTHGRIDEDMYYQYMVEQPDSGYVYGKVKADISTVYMVDENFRVEWYEKTRKCLWFKDEEIFCKIYIPNGSIKEEYSIDLE